MKRTTWMRAACALLAAGVSAGCDNTVQPEARDPLAGLAPGIHPVVVVTGRSGDTTTLELRLHQVGVKAIVASYQGQLGFDGGAVRVAGARVPDGIAGAWNEVQPGRVRFAGAALDGIGERPMLVLRAVSAAPVEAATFTLEMEEVVSAGGGFENVTARVQRQPNPLFMQAPAP